MSSLLKKKVKQQKVISALKGSEPVITEEKYKLSLMQALNYHNYNTPNKKMKEWVVGYSKKNFPKFVSSLNRAPDWEFTTIGIIAHHIMKGQYIADKEIQNLNERIESIVKKYNDATEKTTETKVVVDIQKRIYDQAVLLSDEIDYKIDEFLKTKIVPDFSTMAYLRSKEVSGPVAKKIGEFYEGWLFELEEALAGTDEDLVDGYSNFTKTQLKKFYKFIEDIINDCKQFMVSSKGARKPRARKQKSPLQLVSRMKYMKEEGNLKSVNPIDIIGSKEAWIYNTKYKKLMKYASADNSGLSVKGTTLINYSTVDSVGKTLRKPEEVLKDTTRKSLNDSIKKLKTKASTPNGRVNQDCIILKVF